MNIEPYNQTTWRNSVLNGRIKAERLAVILPEDFDADLNGPAMMHPEAAWNWQRMVVAAAEDGIVLSVIFSYRTLPVQRIKWANFQNGGTLAARPGTSNHGWATALDINLPKPELFSTSDRRRFNWLGRHAVREFGFHNNDATGEPWHWDYEGGHPVEEDDVRFESFAKGVRISKRGDTPTRQEKKDPDLMLGYNLREDGVTLPKPPRPAAGTSRSR